MLDPTENYSTHAPEPAGAAADLSNATLQAAVDLDDGPSLDERFAEFQRMQALGRNPLLVLAGPLLRALAEMPAKGLDARAAMNLHELLVRELSMFTALSDRANLRRDQMLGVRFALCTALDEAANVTDWGGGGRGELGPWSNSSLLYQFHQETNGGEKFFLLLGRLTSMGTEHIDVMEVMLHILGLDFQGHYRTVADGARTLDGLRHRLHGIVMANRPAVPLELSPRWAGVGAGRFKLLRSVPVWLSASVAGLLLFGMFAWFKWEVVHAADPLQSRIAEIGQLRAPERVATPVKLAELLSQEIAAGKLSVTDTDAGSTVVFKGDDMFVAGRGTVNPRARPLLARVGEELQNLAETGPVRLVVIGHSDNQPIATAQFPSNQVLSLKRAQAVSDALQAAMAASAAEVSVETTGAGDSQPVADNATAAGRARNRRVELLVSRP